MSETTNIYSNLSDQTKFRLNEINRIKDYFKSENQAKRLVNTLPLLIILTSL